MTGADRKSELAREYTVRRPNEHDHQRILEVMDEWWDNLGGTLGSRQRALLLPRLFFQHFTRTSLIVERDDARSAAFLVGFVSQSQEQVAYIHFVGVDPELRRAGLGAAVYASFFEDVAERGVRSVRCITSPVILFQWPFTNASGSRSTPATQS
jgi:ribosomal protein S18 acetylase RimI-like enzyme